LPDKAIDVIDEAGAAQHLLPEASGAKPLAPRKSRPWSPKLRAFPQKRLKDDAEVLKDLEKTLKRVVFGQDRDRGAVLAIKLARAGLREPEKPIGNYLFAGPNRCGQNRSGQTAGRYLGVELLRFDMSEYMEKHAYPA
jgi:ATP-dependent Clp protease ATP-binding subunit ClpA